MDFKKALKHQISLRKQEIVNLRKAYDEEEENADYKKSIADTIEAIKAELSELEEMLKQVDEPADDQPSGTRFNPLATMGEYRTLGSMSSTKNRGDKNMINTSEVRGLQKFIFEGDQGGVEMRTAMTTGTAGAVIPESVLGAYVFSGTASSLLDLVSMTTLPHMGNLKLPIYGKVTATAHAENEAVTVANYAPSAVEIIHKELIALCGYSASVGAMSEAHFSEYLNETLLQSVRIQIGDSIIQGNGIGNNVAGLAAQTWTAGTNLVEYTKGGTMAYDDVLDALALLPSRYHRNAVIVANRDTVYGVMRKWEDSAGQRLLDVSGANVMLCGFPVLIDDAVADGEIFVGDAKAIHLNFAEAPMLATDRSSGFDSNTIKVRCTAVYGIGIEPNSFIKVSEAAA